MTVKKIIDIAKGISQIRHTVLDLFKIDMKIAKINSDRGHGNFLKMDMRHWRLSVKGPTIMTSQRERTRLRRSKKIAWHMKRGYDVSCYLKRPISEEGSNTLDVGFAVRHQPAFKSLHSGFPPGIPH